MKMLSVVGARPNFVKIAPIARELAKFQDIEHLIVHTGQHYDEEMSNIFFTQMKIPIPAYDLNISGGSNSQQVGMVMKKLESVIEKESPEMVLVVGDANPALAGALVAKYHKVPLIHVESGLRSFDMSMPEEVNRVCVDRLADLLLVSEESGIHNLLQEGANRSKVHLVGNVMIDSLVLSQAAIDQSDVIERLGLEKRGFGLVTLHRPVNVDQKEVLQRILEVMQKITLKLPLVFPVHPRTQKNIEEWGLSDVLDKKCLIPPLGYIDFLALEKNAMLVMTDSGGVQEESTFLGIPCLTLRNSTERPVTVEIGTNELFLEPEDLEEGVRRVVAGQWKDGKVPKYWDGKTAHRIVEVIRDRFTI